MSASVVRRSIQPKVDGSGVVIAESKTLGYYVFHTIFALVTWQFNVTWCCKVKPPTPVITEPSHPDTRTASADSSTSSISTTSVNEHESEKMSVESILPALWVARPLLWALLVDGEPGQVFAQLGFIKVFILCASFAGPLLLGQMVKLVEKNPSQDDIPLGLLLACTLGASFVALAVLNTQYTIRANVMQVKIRGALSLGNWHQR